MKYNVDISYIYLLMNVYECVEDSFSCIFLVLAPSGFSEKRTCVNSKHVLAVREHVLSKSETPEISQD